MENKAQEEKIAEVIKNLEEFHKTLSEGQFTFGLIAIAASLTDPTTAETAKAVAEMHESYASLIKRQLDLLNGI